MGVQAHRFGWGKIGDGISKERVAARLLPFAPTRALLDQPSEESLFESDIHPHLFAFDPLVAKDLIALACERPVEKRRFHKLKVVGFFEHKHRGGVNVS